MSLRWERDYRCTYFKNINKPLLQALQKYVPFPQGHQHLVVSGVIPGAASRSTPLHPTQRPQRSCLALGWL